MTSNLTRLQQFFTARGYQYPDIPLLQPADPFLDIAGEDLRRRIFMTSDRGGQNLCLRPEFTIPVCLAHLGSGQAQGSYAYGGSVFRQLRDGPAEFLQAGIETIGGRKSIDSDVECITTALDALAHCGQGGSNKMEVVFGDQAIFEALLLALDLPDAWRARLGRAFGDSDKLENDLRLIANGDAEVNGMDATLREALENNNRDGVERWIAAKMKAANLPASGGRTAEHIAERMVGKAQLAATQLSNEQRRILSAFLQIEVAAGEAVAKLREFSVSAVIDIDEAIEIFARRAELLANSANDMAMFTWRASFGRRLDYYTGIVFEIFEPGASQPVCGGGRYDHLMNMLGALSPMPAIGFSIWLDRLSGGMK